MMEYLESAAAGEKLGELLCEVDVFRILHDHRSLLDREIFGGWNFDIVAGIFHGGIEGEREGNNARICIAGLSE